MTASPTITAGTSTMAIASPTSSASVFANAPTTSGVTIAVERWPINSAAKPEPAGPGMRAAWS